jgi:hypothetical protein
MTETRYGKYLNTECVIPSKKTGLPMMSTRQMEAFGAGDFSLDCVYITSPRVMIETPHKHSFAQYLSFFSSNAQDASDFDAEIEICLGEEGEKHIISVPTIVYLEAGLIHGPVVFTRIGKPVLFVDIAMTNRYSRVGEAPQK